MLDWVNVASLILSIVALGIGIVTLPTVFQMVWGGPDIKFDFKHDDDFEKGIRWLRCEIYTRPIEGKVLRALRVRRTTAEDVFARVEVRSEATHHLIGSWVPTIDMIDYEQKARVRIPPSMFPAQFPVASFFRDGQNAATAGGESEEIEDLPPGEYRVVVAVYVGEDQFWADRLLVIGKTAEMTFWGRSLPPRR